MKNLPASIKEASFKTEDEFQADLKTFLDKTSVINLEFESLTTDHEQLKVECKRCGKIFSSNAGAKAHFRYAHTVQKAECKECGQRFSKPSNLKRHTKIVHKSDTSQEF